MSLRCLGPDGQTIHSFDLTVGEWSALRRENGGSLQLRMPCCDASVVMKTSTRGLNFFAHKSRGTCQSAPETEEHLALKMLAVEAARRAGWVCSTEARGASSSGEPWIADVLAQKGQHKVAIEIQWSGQTCEETLYRQARYRQSGVRCLWLFRQPRFPVSKDLPAAYVSGEIATGFEARLSDQVMPLDKFLDAAFARRFRYGIVPGLSGRVSIYSGVLDCWRSNCQAKTRIVTFIEVLVGPHRCQFTVSSLSNFPDLLALCQERIPRASLVGAIKRRYSQTQEQSYMSNGCYRCDALIGQFFEHDAWDVDNVTLAVFQIVISEQWVEAIESLGHEYGWAIFSPE